MKRTIPMEKMRLYTAGIADFESVREDGRIYVDKTELIAFSRETKTIKDWVTG